MHKQFLRWCRHRGSSGDIGHSEPKFIASPPTTVNCTVRKYLTGREIEKLMDYARKHSRYGHRDATMILVAYRHRLRASEVCDLQWHQVELDHGRMHVRGAKNGTPSVHPIRGDEILALRKLRSESPTEAYVFVTERGGPMSTIGFHHLIQRLGKAQYAFRLHPHMLRHACGYKLANDGHDTRALQHYLGHKNIQHTVRYTELSPTGSATSGEISVAGRMRLMSLAGSALGASPPQNLCSLASVPFGGIVIRHGPTPPPPFLETKNQLRPFPQMPGIFSFMGGKYRNLLEIVLRGDL